MDLDVKGSGRKHAVSQVKVDVFVFRLERDTWQDFLCEIFSIDDFWFVICTSFGED